MYSRDGEKYLFLNFALFRKKVLKLEVLGLFDSGELLSSTKLVRDPKQSHVDAD